MTGGVYYNEWDEPTARWLGELGRGGHLPSGHIDTRSIRDVHPDDVAGYDQCHFFAGIGGWPLALRWAGLENVPGIWTGSPPCQPFSVAGKGLAQSDERHLAPAWLNLLKGQKRRPRFIFGEQVEAAIRSGWLDDLFDALEREGYACGAAVLPACSVGAPHIRKRLFFGAVRASHTFGNKQQRSEPCCGSSRRMGRVKQSISWNATWQSSLARFRTVDDGLPRSLVGTDAARNAIVPEVAANFITEFLGAFADVTKNH